VDQDPSLFYTGLVAELYRSLRSEEPDVDVVATFVAASGSPALELGCGDGDPLLDLLERGFDVEGLDSSPDMLDRLRERARARGLRPVLHEARMEDFDLGRSFRSVFCAGPTFTVLPDDRAAVKALARIAKHLTNDGVARIPIHVPPVIPPEFFGVRRELTDGKRRNAVSVVSSSRDENTCTQTTVLRYERWRRGGYDHLEKPWILHWYAPTEFTRLAEAAGLRSECAIDSGPSANDASSDFVATLRLQELA
jgi:SAM-dependent methyltransferase